MNCSKVGVGRLGAMHGAHVKEANKYVSATGHCVKGMMESSWTLLDYDHPIPEINEM